MQKLTSVFFAMIILFNLDSRAADTKTGGGSQSMNPDISVIIDGVAGGWSHRPSSVAGDDPDFGGDSTTRAGGLLIQELEVGFSSVIDPYLKGDAFLTIPSSEKLEIEEAYITSTSLPYDLQLRAGKIRVPFGRQNTQHLHMQDFVRRPLINQTFLGSDGLRPPTIEASIIAPLPFYSTIYFDYMSVDAADDPTAPLQSFGGGAKGSPVVLFHWSNFFDLTESTSLSLGLSAAQGRASVALNPTTNTVGGGNNMRSQLYGADLYLKYKPANSASGYFNIAWQSEFMYRQLLTDDIYPTTNDGGAYTQLVFQLTRQFLIGLRYDVIGLPTSTFTSFTNRYSASATYVLSEFSRLRLYGEQEYESSGIQPSDGVFAQFEISMGSHGAHPF